MTANHVIEEKQAQKKERYEQLNLFTDYGKKELEEKEAAEAKEREKHLQHALLEIKKRYGKNAVLKGMNLEEMTEQMRRSILSKPRCHAEFSAEHRSDAGRNMNEIGG